MRRPLSPRSPVRRLFAASSIAITLLLVAATSATAQKTFKWEKTGPGQYSVVYNSRTVVADLDNMVVFLQGNTGQLCLDEGFAHARMENIERTRVDLGIRKDIPQVATTVEMFHEPSEGTTQCTELAERPKTPKELKTSGKTYELPPSHSIQIEMEEDPFEGHTIARGSWHRLSLDLDGNTVGGPITLDLAPHAVIDGKIAFFNLHVRYMGKDWIFIREGESLIFRIDGEILRLLRSTYDSKILDLDAGVYERETATYGVSPADILKIANGSEVIVRLEGKKGSIDRQVPPFVRDNLRYFHDQFEKAPEGGEDAAGETDG